MVSAAAGTAQGYELLNQVDFFRSAAESAQLTPEEFEFYLVNSHNIDVNKLDPDKARELKSRIDEIYEKIVESPFYRMQSGLIKAINKIAGFAKKIFKARQKDGHETSETAKKNLGDLDKVLAILDVIQPLTLGVDAYALYKQLGKAKLPWDYVKVGASGTKLLSNVLKVPDTVNSVIKQFKSDYIPDIKFTKALFGLHVFSQAFSVISGVLSTAKQWNEAKKTIELVEASFSTLGLIGNVIDIPATIVKKIVLFNPAFEAVSKVATWAPGLGVVSALLSAASVAAAGCSMAKSIKYKNRLERTVEEAAIKYLSLSQEHTLRDGPAREQFQKAVIAVEHREAAGMLKKMMAELAKGEDPETLQATYNTLVQCIGAMKEGGTCSRDIALWMEQQSVLWSAELFAEQPSYRAGLKTVLEEELKRVRQVRSNFDFTALMRDIQVEINKLGAPLLQQLEKIGQEAYLGKILATPDKVVEYHFNAPASDLKKSAEKILDISQSNLGSEIVEGVKEAVNCLKERVVQKISGDTWTLVTSIISLVATIILAVLAFGLSCTPLAPLAYALLAVAAVASVSKILYDHVSKNKFRENFSQIENRLSDQHARLEQQRYEQRILQEKEEAIKNEEQSQIARKVIRRRKRTKPRVSLERAA